MISRSQSVALFAEALQYIPGGVNSPVRAFRAVGGTPFLFREPPVRDCSMSTGMNSSITSEPGDGDSRACTSENYSSRQHAASLGTSFGVPNPLKSKWRSSFVTPFQVWKSPLLQFGHGSHHVRDSARARFYGP